MVKIDRFHPDAIMPVKATDYAAGYDIFSIDDLSLTRAFDDHYKIRTGLKIKIPKGYVGLLCSRSGTVADSSYRVANQPGIIDADFRGELIVLIEPLDVELVIHKGDRIAQLVIVPTYSGSIMEGTVSEDTKRGKGDLGSTGK